MMNFKDFADYEWFTFTVDGYVVHILFANSDGGLLVEGKSKTFELGGQYSAMLHQAHSNPGQIHIHVYAKNRKLFAMNQDGSAHDRSHQTRIPNEVATAISKKFPSFTLPPDNFIESAPREINSKFGAQLLLG